MSLLREVKPRSAIGKKIVKARQTSLLVEERKRILVLHGGKCPEALRTVLKAVTTLTKPHNVQLNKKNENVHPFEDAASLEFLALKNQCALVVFGTHSKKRPNNVTILRLFNEKALDMFELLLLTTQEELQAESSPLQVGIEMKPMMLFAGSQWDDNSSSESAMLFAQVKSSLVDLFQGEEISSIDVAGLQYVLMVAAGENNASADASDLASKPIIHLRWYKVRTTRSDTPKVPRVELDQVGPIFDFRIGRHQFADPNVMKEAMKHGRRPNEAKTKKNVETDIMGDKLGRIHLGKQDLGQLQTRKMKGLKRGRDEDKDIVMNGSDVEDEEDLVSQDEDDETGGIELDEEEELMSGDGSSIGGTDDEIDIGESDVDDDQEADQKPKRQRIG